MSVNVKTENGLTKLAGLYNASEISAEGVSYDNTETGMTADNVQDAIDEVFQYGNNRKSQLVDKIVAKGGESSTSESWDNVIEDIDTIPSGGSDVTTRVLVGNTVTGVGSGSASGDTNIDDVTEIILRLWLWCPDISVAGNVSVTINNTDTYQLSEYTHYEYEDAYHSIRTYRMTIPSTDVTRIGYSFSGLSYNQGSQFHGEISLKHMVSGGDLINLTELASKTSPANNATNVYTFTLDEIGDNDSILFLSFIDTGNGGGTQCQNKFVSIENADYILLKDSPTLGSGYCCMGIIYNITDDVNLSILHNMANTFVVNTVRIYGLNL